MAELSKSNLEARIRGVKVMDFFAVLAFALFVNACLSGVVAYVAGLRNKSAAGFFWLSFLLSFIVGILVLIALPADNALNMEARLPCPHCDELASRNARICPHCRLEVASHFQNLKKREEKDLAQKTKAALAEEMAFTKRAQVEAEARRIIAQKYFRNPITWVVLIALVAGAATVVVFQVLERERIAKLLSPNCSVIQDSVEISFDSDMEVEFSLPSECVTNLSGALDEGLLDPWNALGVIQTKVFLDNVFAGELAVRQIRDLDRYQVRIPNKFFWDHASERPAAKAVTVELSYQSGRATSSANAQGGLPQSAIAKVSREIPESKPQVRLVRGVIREDLSLGSYIFIALLQYETYQAADSFSFDWPGNKSDGIGSWRSELMTSSHISSSTSAQVVVSVIQNDKVIQTIRESSR